MGEHAWAQCDRASTALLYYEDNANFFLPQTHNLMYNPDGIASGEFPLLSYFAAGLYTIFGPHEYLYRILVFIFSLSGFILGFFVCNRFIKHKIYVVMAACLWLFSPNLIYYSTGFLPDTFSLSLFMTAFYFLTRDYPSINRRNIAGFAAFSCLAVLEKSSTLFVYSAVCLPLLIMLFKTKSNMRSFLKNMLILCIPLLVAISWLVYSGWLQHIYPSVVFLLKPKLPSSLVELKQFFFSFRDRSENYYHYRFFILAAISLPSAFILLFRRQQFLLWSSICVFVAWCAFFILMSRQAWFHGYYHIPFQFMFFLLFLALFMGIDRFQPKKWMQTIILLLFLAFGWVNLHHNSRNFAALAFNTKFINNDWNTAEAALRAAGLKPEDKVLSYPDPSYNISLYLMNQRGWNAAPDYWDITIVDALKDCDYMVLADTNLLQRDCVKPFHGALIATHNSLFIYRIKK